MTRITAKVDSAIDYAVGKHRNDINWKNTSSSFQKLAERCSHTHRTAETYAEYQALSNGSKSNKLRKDEIKDIGGFVFAFLAAGKRKKEAVIHKHGAAFDADYAHPEFYEIVKRVFPGEAWFLYTTHSHSQSKPRYRFVVLFSRPVTTAEYEPVCRRITEKIGIDQFDHTTYDVNRLMYWPSTSKDGEFIFKENQGSPIDVDQVLESYCDWKNITEWPLGERENKGLRAKISKAEDPTLKKDWIGAWCRTYTVTDVIDKHLLRIYEACEVNDRWSYKDGSTSGGLIVYEDKFAYSHHGTDPISGKLCNAFDLVRIHNFGHLDTNVQLGTPINRLPSFGAMIDFIQSDPGTIKEMYTETLTEFEGLEQSSNIDWVGGLEMVKGRIKVTVSNLRLILDNDSSTKGLFAFDQHAQRETLLQLPGWKRKSLTLSMTDSDEHQILEIIEQKYRISGIEKKVAIALSNVFSNNGYHPIKDYLKSFIWDGKERLSTLFIDYFGAEDSEYTREVTRKTFIAAIARVYTPGIKFDNVMVLVGPQGIGKSTILAILGGEWFSDSFGDLNKEKSAEESLQGVWIMELGELAGLRKNDTNRIKHFISKQIDRYRVSYGKRTEAFPRQCIFIGTTNDLDFLSDPTGNRRFWPVLLPGRGLKNVWRDLPVERDQIWAEAVAAFESGESLHLSSDLEAQATFYQSRYTVVDEWEVIIKEYLEIKLPENWRAISISDRRICLDGGLVSPAVRGTVIRDRVSTPEIWSEALRGEKKDLHTHVARRIKNIMRNMPGWEESDGKLKIDGVSVRGFVRMAT